MADIELQAHKTNAHNRELTVLALASDTEFDCPYYEVRMPPHSEGQAYYVLKFQHGPVKEQGFNGLTNEALLAVVKDRLERFQKGPFKCRQNALALTKIEEALHWMRDRTHEREMRGVEGTNQP